jgi:hypothetical protein
MMANDSFASTTNIGYVNLAGPVSAAASLDLDDHRDSAHSSSKLCAATGFARGRASGFDETWSSAAQFCQKPTKVTRAKENLRCADLDWGAQARRGVMGAGATTNNYSPQATATASSTRAQQHWELHS